MSLPVPLEHRATYLLLVLSILDLQALHTNGMQITSISYESGRISQISVRSEFEDRGQTEHCLNVLPADQPMHNDPENALIPFDHIIVPYESKGSHLSETRKDKAIGAKVSRPDGLLTWTKQLCADFQGRHPDPWLW